MSTNVFFNNYGRSQEQFLYQDLIIEAIRQFGIDFYYLPRTLNNYDPLYGADDISSYDAAFPIEMYVASYDGFEGDGDFLSKFGLEIRDRMTFVVAKRIFDNEIGSVTKAIRPNEGDLIYYPLNQKLFEIKYVQNKPIHYPLGDLPTFELFAELFQVSDERFNTGIEELDQIQMEFSQNILDYSLHDSLGNYLVNENGDILVNSTYQNKTLDPILDNNNVNAISDPILDFSESNPFSEFIKG